MWNLLQSIPCIKNDDQIEFDKQAFFNSSHIQSGQITWFIDKCDSRRRMVGWDQYKLWSTLIKSAITMCVCVCVCLKLHKSKIEWTWIQVVEQRYDFS